MKMMKIAAVVLGLSLLIPFAALADETGDALEQGLKFYKEGKLTKAIGELEFALAQLKQQKAEAMQKLLPEPPDGWKSVKGKSTAAGGGFLAGGVSASRTYREAQGRGSVEIQIISDSPMIGGMATMLSNPAFMQSSQGAKLIRFQGQKAMVTSKVDNRAELQTLINNKMLFKVSVNRVKGAAEVAKKFGKMVDLEKLAQYAQ
jgi:hypothetical protein